MKDFASRSTGWVSLLLAASLWSACQGESETGGNPEPQEPGPQTGQVSPKPSPKEQTPIDCSKLEATGTEIGDVAPNLTLLNGQGQEVNLHSYCNDTVILIASEY